VRPGSQVEHFDGVVAKRCDEQALPRHIDGQMIDSPFYTRQFNRAYERERFLPRGRLHRDEEHSGGD
jgi:hypothetical protein